MSRATASDDLNAPQLARPVGLTIGVVGGTIGGLLGGGSGVFFVPSLDRYAGARKVIHGTATVANFAVCGVGALVYAVAGGAIDMRAGLGLIIGGFFGAGIVAVSRTSPTAAGHRRRPGHRRKALPRRRRPGPPGSGLVTRFLIDAPVAMVKARVAAHNQMRTHLQLEHALLAPAPQRSEVLSLSGGRANEALPSSPSGWTTSSRYPTAPSMQELLRAVPEDSRPDIVQLGMQILVEGLALAAFALTRDTTNDPLIRAITAYVMQDEARHVAFDRLGLRDLYRELSPREIAEREEFVVEACHLMRDRLTGN